MLICTGTAGSAEPTGGTQTAEPIGGTKSTEPIVITADEMVVDNRNNRADFMGNARAVQAQFTVSADKLTLIYTDSGTSDGKIESDNIEKIVALGNVRMEFDDRVATSEKAEYFYDERKLILSGPATKVVSGRDEVSGSTITFYREDGRVESAGNDKKQVKAIIHTNDRGLN